MIGGGRVKAGSAWGILAIALVTLGCGPETYHGRFLGSWSPDGTHAAAVTNLLEETQDSGIWIFDANSGQSRQIFSLSDGRYCIHPQWSPFANEVLFATLPKDPEGTKNPTETLMPYSVWVIGADGYGLRKIADAVTMDTSGDSDFPTFTMPNTVTWGAEPGTVIMQNAVGDKVTALLFDPYTGRLTEFLPHGADAYSLEPSPSRRQVAALLYDKDTNSAEVFLSDFGFGNWRRLAIVGFDPEQLDIFSPMIYWSPDSSWFVLPEEEPELDSNGKPRHFLRLFDPRTGSSQTIAAGNPNTDILWDESSSSFFFSAASDGGDSDSFIYRFDRATGRTVPIVSQGDNFLVSWNWETQRICFYRRLSINRHDASEEAILRQELSCTGDGSDVRQLSPWIEGQGRLWCLSPEGRRLVLLDTVPQLLDLDVSDITLLGDK